MACSHCVGYTSAPVFPEQVYLGHSLPLETAMANKNDFTPEEWTKVLESIVVAGIAVSAADPSGLWGTLKKPLQAAWRSLRLSAIPILTNSSRQQLLI